MNRILQALAVCFHLISIKTEAQAQVSYDDILVLLNAKKYEQAEPFLKKYLAANPTHANANLFMGIVFQEKISKTEDEIRAMALMDSALIYFTKAGNNLTVSHVKANEKYYQMYNRRDLRTGEVGIKYEDIKLDIDIRKSSLTGRLLSLCRSGTVTSSMTNTLNQDNSGKVELKPKGKSYALVIGVSAYDNYKLNLAEPVTDAKKFAEVLVRYYQFDSLDVMQLLNPNRQQILNELFNYRKRLSTEDNLLIFYAGHGTYDEDAGQGYWWPRDADSESPSNWLSNSDLRDQIRGIKAAHTLLIADACFSGGIFRTRGSASIRNAPLDIISLYKLTSRRAITSGTMTTVPDQSVFFDYLLKALRENNARYLSSQTLFDSFRTNVINNTLQVPQDGIISETGDTGGDFIFIKRQ